MGALILWSLQTGASLQSTENVDSSTRELDVSFDTIQKTNAAGTKSQAKIDGIHDETLDLLQQFKDASEGLQRYHVNIEQLSQIKNRQAEKEALLSSQIDKISETETALVPMLVDMVDALAGFIQQDLPFLHDERHKRISTLRTMITAPELSLPEKYRQVLDAYEIEREFGYTIETYPEEIKLDNTNMRVNVLRIGRVAIYFQTKDGLQQGIWEAKTQQWKHLPSNYYSPIKTGIDMASEESVPQLLTLPLFSEQIINQLHAAKPAYKNIMMKTEQP